MKIGEHVMQEELCPKCGDAPHEITLDRVTTLGAEYAALNLPCAGNPATKLRIFSRACLSCRSKRR